MLREISLDIETLGLLPSAVIVSIGACVINQSEYPCEDFHVKIDTNSQFGRHVDQSTLNWWSQPSQRKAYESEFGGTIRLREALRLLAEYIGLVPNTLVWANHDLFDIGVLQDAYRSYDEKPPWSYRDIRDLATLKDSPVARYTLQHSRLKNDQSHSSIGDARFQAEQIRRIQHSLIMAHGHALESIKETKTNES